MHKTVSKAAEFQKTWDARVNFLMAGACVPFSFTFPSTRDIVERLVFRRADYGNHGPDAQDRRWRKCHGTFSRHVI